MTRIIFLSLAGTIVFAGFAAPFFLAAPAGYIAAGALLFAGSILFLVVERKTRKLLDEESAWNRTMKADGDALLEGDDKS